MAFDYLRKESDRIIDFYAFISLAFFFDSNNVLVKNIFAFRINAFFAGNDINILAFTYIEIWL